MRPDLSPDLNAILGERVVELRRSARAKRLSLSVSRIDGRVRVTAPPRSRKREVAAFLEHHADWLRGVMDRALEAQTLSPGATIPLLGRDVEIRAAPGRSVWLAKDGAVLYVGGSSAGAGARVEAYLRLLARDKLFEASTRYAARLGVRFSKLTVRDTRSRWGSCTADAALSYSWRLVLAPLEVLEYVAAHEVAHIVELNHSPRFWAVVEKLRPTWRRERAWLRRHGLELHRYTGRA